MITGRPVLKLWAILGIDSDGDESLVAHQNERGTKPYMTADEDAVDAMVDHCERNMRSGIENMRLVCFENVVECRRLTQASRRGSS